MCNFFGGPSGAEETAQAETSSLARTLSAHAEQEFGQQQSALSQLQQEIQKISTGQTGLGFSAPELSARTGQIESEAGANARNVEQAVANQGAGQIFGGNQDTSGLGRGSAIRRQIGEEALSNADIAKSNAIQNLTAQDYAQGRVNAATTVGGLDALAGKYNPAQFYNEATGAEGQSFGEASKIQSEKSTAAGVIGGLLKTGIGLGSDFLTGGMSGLVGTGGESFFGKAGDFFKGGVSSLGNG